MPMENCIVKKKGIVETTCSLCISVDKLIKHIFFECIYSKWLLKETLEEVGGLLDHNRSTNFETLATMMEQITKSTPIWGLHWSLIAALS